MLRRIFVLLFTSFFLFSPKVEAVEPQFAASQEVIYQIQPDGAALVTQNFAITNLASDLFPKEYQFSLGQLKVTNIGARDRIGPLAIKTQATVSGTDVHLTFNDQVAGLGKILRFTLFYQVKDLAQKPGRLWQIFIPPTPKAPGLTEFAIRLVTPTSFGKIVLVKPKIQNSDLFWQGTNFSTVPIVVTFDPTNEKVVYDAYNFTLKYHLYNSRLYPVKFLVALPSDYANQKTFLRTLLPKAVDVTQDSSSNWLASYQLGPTQRLDVTATGETAIFLEPISNQSVTTTSAEDTKPGKFWPQDNQTKEAIRGHSLPYDIYNLTLGSLEYQKEREDSPRRGAKLALLTPEKSSAWDFADVFVSLARSAKISSRVVFGWQQRLGKSHVWNQFYNSSSKTWLMIDPTLEKLAGLDYFQTLDTQHIAIAMLTNDQKFYLPDEIIITPKPANLDPTTTSHVTAMASFPNTMTAGFTNSGKVFVENLGPTAFHPQTVSLTSPDLEFDHNVFLTSLIPPFGHQEFSTNARPAGWGTQKNVIITLKFGLDTQQYSIAIVPLYKNIYLVVFGGLIILGLISIVTQITRGLLLQKRHRRNPVRRQGELSS